MTFNTIFQKENLSSTNLKEKISNQFRLLDSPQLLFQLSSYSKKQFILSSDTSNFQNQLAQGTSARIFSAKEKPRTKYAKMKELLTNMIQKINKMSHLNVPEYCQYQQSLFSVFFSDLIHDISKQCKEKAQILKILWATMFQLTSKITKHLTQSLEQNQSNQLKQIIATHEGYQGMIDRDKQNAIEMEQAFKQNEIILNKLVKDLRQKRKQNKKFKKIIGTLLQKINEKQKNYIELEQQYLSSVLSNKNSVSKEKTELLMQRKINLTEERRSILKLKNSAKQVVNKVKSQFAQQPSYLNIECKERFCQKIQNIINSEQQIDEILDEFQYEHEQAKTQFKSEVEFARIHFQPIVVDASTNTIVQIKKFLTNSETQTYHSDKLQYDIIQNKHTNVDDLILKQEKIVQTNQRSLFQSYRFKIYEYISERILPEKCKKESTRSLVKHKIKKPKITKNSLKKQISQTLNSFEKVGFDSEIQSRDLDGVSSINQDLSYQVKFNRIALPQKRSTAISNSIFNKPISGIKSIFQKEGKAGIRQSQNFIMNKVIVSNTFQQPIFSIDEESEKPQRLRNQATKMKKQQINKRQGVDLRRLKTEQAVRSSKVHRNELNSSYFLEQSSRQLMKKMGKSNHRKREKYNKANVFLKDLQYLPTDLFDSSESCRNVTDFIEFFKHDLDKQNIKRAQTPGSTNVNLIVKYLGQTYCKALELVSKNNYLTNILLPFSKVIQLAYGNTSKQQTFQKMIQLIKQIKLHQQNYIFYTFLYISGLVDEQQAQGITVMDIIVFLNFIDKLNTSTINTNILLNAGKFSQLSTSIGKFKQGIREIFLKFDLHQNLVDFIQQAFNDYTSSIMFEISDCQSNNKTDEKIDIELLKASFFVLKQILKIKSKIKTSLQLNNERQIPKKILEIIVNSQLKNKHIKQILRTKYSQCKSLITANEFVQICLKIGFRSIQQLQKNFIIKYELPIAKFNDLIEKFDKKVINVSIQQIEQKKYQQKTEKELLADSVKIEQIDKRLLVINEIQERVSSILQQLIGMKLSTIYEQGAKHLTKYFFEQK